MIFSITQHTQLTEYAGAHHWLHIFPLFIAQFQQDYFRRVFHSRLHINFCLLYSIYWLITLVAFNNWRNHLIFVEISDSVYHLIQLELPLLPLLLRQSESEKANSRRHNFDFGSAMHIADIYRINIYRERGRDVCVSEFT